MTLGERALAEAPIFDAGRSRRNRAPPPDDDDQRAADREWISHREEAIDNRRIAMQPLWARMDADYSDGYRQDPYNPPASDGIDAQDVYTDNAPRTLSDRVVGAITMALPLVRVQNEGDDKDQREINNAAESLALGMLGMANKRALKAGKPSVQAQLSWSAPNRGAWCIGRALLLKDRDGETIVDGKVFDPRNVVMQLTEDEPLWIAFLSQRNRADIRDEYPDFRFDDNDEPREDQEDRQSVTDYWWREDETVVDAEGNPVLNEDGTPIILRHYLNAVWTGDQFLKRRQDTFAEMFPIIPRAIGSNPGVANFDIRGGDDSQSRTIPGIEDFGDSVYGPNRRITKLFNRVMSLSQNMMAKASKGVYVHPSTMGDKTLDEPPTAGSEVPVATADDESLELLPTPEMTNSHQALIGTTSEAKIHGGLPLQSSGILQQAVSGRALNIMRSAEVQRVMPFLIPVQSCLEGMVEAWFAQYKTGRYRPLRVSGTGRDRVFFDREIPPDALEGQNPQTGEPMTHGPVTVKLVADFPEDRMEKWQIVAIANQPNPQTGEPVLSTQSIRDDVLEMQDADLERTRVFGQLARFSDPIIMLLMQREGALADGDQETVAFLEHRIRQQMERDAMQEAAQRFAFIQAMGTDPMAAAAAGIGGQGGRQNGAGGPGGPGGLNAQGSQRNVTSDMRPETMPLSGTVLGQPGAASEDDQRLAAIGLERGR